MTEIVKDLAVGAARLARRHVFGYTRSAPPIFLGLVIKDAPTLHTETVAVGFGADSDDFCLYPLFGKKFAPYFSRFGVLRDAVLLIADKCRYVQMLGIETDF